MTNEQLAYLAAAGLLVGAGAYGISKTSSAQYRPRGTLFLTDGKGNVMAGSAGDALGSEATSPYYFPGGGVFEEEGVDRRPTKEELEEGVRREALEELGYAIKNYRQLKDEPINLDMPEWWKERQRRKRNIEYKGLAEYYGAAEVDKEDRSLYNIEGDAFKGGWTPIDEVASALEKADPNTSYGPANLEQARLLRAIQQKTASESIRSQEDIYEELLPSLPKGTHHVSGGLPDARGISDVDIYYPTKDHKDLLSVMPKGTSVLKSNDSKTMYSIPGYGREVNLYATLDPQKEESIHHRATMLALAEKYPELAERAFKIKAGGKGSEPAWAEVLGLEGDPYDVMANTESVMAHANKVAPKLLLKKAIQDKTAAKGTATKRDPKKWSAAKSRAKAKMGGKWSARAAQLAVKYYKDSGGSYSGKKPTKENNNLKKWTKEEWGYRPGSKAEKDSKKSPSSGTKGRYLPKKKWQSLSKSEQKATDAKKRKAISEGKGIVANTAKAKYDSKKDYTKSASSQDSGYTPAQLALAASIAGGLGYLGHRAYQSQEPIEESNYPSREPIEESSYLPYAGAAGLLAAGILGRNKLKGLLGKTTAIPKPKPTAAPKPKPTAAPTASSADDLVDAHFLTIQSPRSDSGRILTVDEIGDWSARALKERTVLTPEQIRNSIKNSSSIGGGGISRVGGEIPIRVRNPEVKWVDPLVNDSGKLDDVVQGVNHVVPYRISGVPRSVAEDILNTRGVSARNRKIEDAIKNSPEAQIIREAATYGGLPHIRLVKETQPIIKLAESTLATDSPVHYRGVGYKTAEQRSGWSPAQYAGTAAAAAAAAYGGYRAYQGYNKPVQSKQESSYLPYVAGAGLLAAGILGRGAIAKGFKNLKGRAPTFGIPKPAPLPAHIPPAKLEQYRKMKALQSSDIPTESAAALKYTKLFEKKYPGIEKFAFYKLAMSIKSKQYPEGVSPRFQGYISQKRTKLTTPITDLPQPPPPANDSEKTRNELLVIKMHMEEGKLPESLMILADREPEKIFYIACEKLGIDPKKEKASAIKEDFNKIAFDLKYIFKRPRPWSLSDYHGVNLNVTVPESADTPSYPSGHAMMGYGLAEFYKTHYPEYSKQWDGIADIIQHSRLQAGVHFPSDNEYSKRIVDEVSSREKVSIFFGEEAVLGGIVGAALAGEGNRALGSAAGAGVTSALGFALTPYVTQPLIREVARPDIRKRLEDIDKDKNMGLYEAIRDKGKATLEVATGGIDPKVTGKDLTRGVVNAYARSLPITMTAAALTGLGIRYKDDIMDALNFSEKTASKDNLYKEARIIPQAVRAGLQRARGYAGSQYAKARGALLPEDNYVSLVNPYLSGGFFGAVSGGMTAENNKLEAMLGGAATGALLNRAVGVRAGNIAGAKLQGLRRSILGGVQNLKSTGTGAVEAAATKKPGFFGRVADKVNPKKVVADTASSAATSVKDTGLTGIEKLLTRIDPATTGAAGSLAAKAGVGALVTIPGAQLAGHLISGDSRMNKLSSYSSSEDHSESRRKERAAHIPKKRLDSLRKAIEDKQSKIPKGTHHVRMDNATAVIKDVGDKHVLATVLGPNMKAPGKNLQSKLL